MRCPLCIYESSFEYKLSKWWIIIESEILLLKLDQKQKEKKAEIIKESDFEIIPESKDQVCGILNISDSEFKSIMNAHESGIF